MRRGVASGLLANVGLFDAVSVDVSIDVYRLTFKLIEGFGVASGAVRERVLDFVLETLVELFAL